MHKALLRRWCDAMLKYQLHDTGDTRLDGGLLCPACMRVHGRSADAILPLVTQWQTDGDRALPACRGKAVYMVGQYAPPRRQHEQRHR